MIDAFKLTKIVVLETNGNYFVTRYTDHLREII